MSGRLYWVTGLSGAGKSSLSRKLFDTMKPQNPALVYLDGDTLRDILDLNGCYEQHARHQIAMKYSRLCHLLTTQGLDVICATISMFDDVRVWNRKHISNYTEIYLEVSPPVLQQRNHRGLYGSQPGQHSLNVVGLDIEAQLPKKPDFVLRNDGNKSIDELSQDLLKLI